MAAEQIKLRTATVTDVPTIRQLAHDTWWPTYGAYIDHGQISLMLELIYSKNALRTQLAAGQCFAPALRRYCRWIRRVPPQSGSYNDHAHRDWKSTRMNSRH